MGLKGKHLVVTAGATRAYLDDIRFLTNTATGRLGCEVAGAAADRGAQVTLIRGRDSVDPASVPSVKRHVGRRIRVATVDTIDDLSQVLRRALKRPTHGVVHSMGVQDYVPVRRMKGKRSTKRGSWRLTLKPAPKVINEVKRWSPGTRLVGCKLLSGVTRSRLLQEALRLKRRCQADAVLANDWQSVRTGERQAYLVTDEGIKSCRGTTAVAKMIVDFLE